MNLWTINNNNNNNTNNIEIPRPKEQPKEEESELGSRTMTSEMKKDDTFDDEFPELKQNN